VEREELKREVLAGLTTFFTMSYILVVNPAILSAAGMPKEGVIFATAVSAAIATFLMGVYAKLPFALAPGMGLNAYFAYTVCGQMGIPWQTALAAVFLEGVIFLVLALFGARRAIFRSIPRSLAYAISAGIGLFIALIGLKNAGIVTYSKATLLQLGNLKEPQAVITLLSLILITLLVKKGVKGSLLIGIGFATALAAALGMVKAPHAVFGFPHPETAFKLSFHQIFSLQIVPVITAFLLVDVFDTVGTLSALCTRLGIELHDKRVGRALTCDAVGTTVGGLLGTSTVTTYVESASGVAAGGKTGLTAVTVAALFALSLFLYPLISVVPEFATSAVLIFVGYFMVESLKNVEWSDVTEALPAFVTLIGIPLTFSISDGMGLGFITYTAVKLLSGKFKDLNYIIILISLIFAAKFFA
jgi:AGZA family xanthine/uracil permease-like MFS transporter